MENTTPETQHPSSSKTRRLVNALRILIRPAVMMAAGFAISALIHAAG